MNNEATVLGSVYQQLAKVASSHGILVTQGQPPSLYSSNQADKTRVRQDAFRSLWQQVGSISGAGPRSIAMAVASEFRISDAGTLGYLMRSAPTVRASLGVLSRYSRLFDELLTVRIEDRSDTKSVELRLSSRSGYHPAYAEALLGALVQSLRECVGGSGWAPLEVFIEATSSENDGRKDFFGCPVRFSQPRNALSFADTCLAQPLPGHDPILHSILTEHAEALMTRLPNRGDVREQVERILHQSVGKGTPKVDVIAKRLGVSARTLQRRLAETGDNYASLVDQFREASAMRLLDDNGLAIYDVAELLGFSEPKAFRRAFKRWTGKSPRSHRTERRAFVRQEVDLKMDRKPTPSLADRIPTSVYTQPTA